MFAALISCKPPNVSNSLSIAPPNGRYIHSTANVACQDGYTGKGASGVITCLNTSKWSEFYCQSKHDFGQIHESNYFHKTHGAPFVID